MRMVGFTLFWLLALHGASVQGVSISNVTRTITSIFNTTRTTTRRLWTMATNDNDLHNMVVRKLEGYAIDCCTSRKPAQGGYGLGKDQDYCERRQLAYWAFVDRRAYTNPNKPDIPTLEKWLDANFNPSVQAQQNLNAAKYLCLGTGNQNDDSPSFAVVDRTLMKPILKPNSWGQ